MSTELGFQTTLPISQTEAIEKVTAALKVEGFGILTEIDVKATMKKKLEVDVAPYMILGACNPNLAHRAMQAVPEVGLLLPCNVIVYETGAGQTTISIIDPIAMMSVVDNPTLAEVANEARARLERVSAALQA